MRIFRFVSCSTDMLFWVLRSICKVTTVSPLKSRHWDTVAATLDALREYDLAPVPELFHVWFVFFADDNPDIVRSIELARQQGTAIDEKQLLDLYYRYILHRHTTDFLRQGMESFADVIENSEQSIASVSSELGIYHKVLEEADAVLRRDGKPSDLLTAVSRHTRKVQKTVSTLAEQLDSYHQQIAHLQSELQKAQEQSLTDGLTRVSNRLHFEQILTDLCHAVDEGEDSEPFCLMMIDLDQFKQVNDRYGHRVGDEILVLIAGMLPMAKALEKTGGLELMVETIMSYVGNGSPMLVMAALFLLTSGLSQVISNTATTVLIVPVAFGIAQIMGLAPQPFLMTVALSASSAFATPVASPVNTLVLGPGKYSFMDFVKVGLPLQALVMLVTMLVVPIFFPF